MLSTTFNLQGHRGARGLRPENTLPSFEAALDAGVTSIETDLHLSRDGHVILCHDAALDHPLTSVHIRDWMLAQLRTQRADANPDPGRFPEQRAIVSPAAAEFARQRALEPFGLPTLDDLFEFVQTYSRCQAKSEDQRRRAARLVFDLELKRVPGRPQRIGDNFDGRSPGLLEERVLESVMRHGVLNRTVVRSFDHRCIRALKQREPRLLTAILVAATAPVDPAAMVRQAGASIYCPDVNFLDEATVRELHAAGIAVLPWTVNDPADWERLLAWNVDGITTDYPERLAELLRARGIEF